jgi:vacuole morphology and inheritance protein 14
MYFTYRFADDEIQQLTGLRWLSEFLNFAHEIMVPFTPRLILAILPNLAHDVPMIQSAAVKTNKLLLNVVQSLPSPAPSMLDLSSAQKSGVDGKANPAAPSPTPTANSVPTRHSSKDQVIPPVRDINSPELAQEPALAQGQKPKGPGATPTQKDIDNAAGNLKQQAESSLPVLPSRPESPVSTRSGGIALPPIGQSQQATTVTPGSPIAAGTYALDHHATVNALTIQFMSDHEETRVAALRWLIMLHQKSPKAYTSKLGNLLRADFALTDPCYGRWNVSRPPQDTLGFLRRSDKTRPPAHRSNFHQFGGELLPSIHA